ncbi:hypothetical protein [Hoeflea sp.]|uniref:hypothetical protein n=1 Tax=Hoeflea sp. TaxID=1940281 RepID=UPI003B0144DA
MRHFASILLAICFVSVSALASYGKAGASHMADPVIVAVEQVMDSRLDSQDAAATDQSAAEGGADCPCEKKSDPLTLTCGVTLALSGDGMGGCFPGAKHALSGIVHAERNTQMMYLLRRPPRLTL